MAAVQTKKSMDLLGKALKAYLQGEKVKFYLKDHSGEMFRVDLKRFLRKPNQISKIERRLISQSYGRILDVGCATGNYIPLLAGRGDVLGIDISPNMIDIARKNGNDKCQVADIFKFNSPNKFDTITCLGNNLGMGGTVAKTKKLLAKLSDLLKKEGQILAVMRRLPDRDYAEVKIQPVWSRLTGPKFEWIHLNIDFLSELCERTGLNLKPLKGNQHCHLVRITKTYRS